ncbi:HAD-IIB family hydrolase [Limosilactobacillus caecicola]|uniref:HAD-IIB family hydrolase n=1 Tax=Limosilactobacillus caecicola TaxID=2941332 RepID=UPI0020419123|nr:HAD-IIB family hydrolase [Limosilactobacillus caecicola]
MINYLISDMDHTLLQEHGQLDQFTIDVVRQSPVHLSLASARNPLSMVKFVQQLGLTGLQLAMNGALLFKVRHGQVQVVQSRVIQYDVAVKVQRHLHEKFPEIDFTWITAKHWYIPKLTTEMRVEMNYSSVQPVIGGQLNPQDLPYQIVLIIKNPQRFREVQTDLKAVFPTLSIHNSGDGYLTINAPGANKGTLVEYLVTNGVPLAQIAGVGDDQNDLPLLMKVGYSLAVANAAPNIKAMVDQVIGSNSADGIANFLAELNRKTN